MGYACVRQRDQSDCGAAALATIALHHGRAVGLQKVREFAGTDRIGTNLSGMIEGASKLGFSARAVKGPFEALAGVPLPAIAHVVTEQRLGHFVVLHRVGKQEVVLADPAQGVVRWTTEQFRARWTGYLILLAKDREPEDAPTGAASGALARFLGLLAPNASVLAEAFVCALLLTALGLSTSFFIRHLADSVLAHGETRILNALAIGMLLVLVFRTLFGALRQYLLTHVSRRIDLMLVSRYVGHILRQPMRFFEMRRVGEILSRLSDAAKVRQAVSGTALTVVVDATLVALSLLVMFLYDAGLAAIACACIPVYLAVVLLHHPSARRQSRAAMEEAAAVQNGLAEDVGGIEAIKTAGAERRRAEHAEERIVRAVRANAAIQMTGLRMSSLGMFVTAAAGIAILWLGGHRVIEGALTLGELMFFYTLLGHMLAPLERLASVHLQVQEAVTAVDRLYEILDLETEELHAPGKAELGRLEREIAFEDVAFRYGCRADLLKDVRLRIPAGATVAIVGESGSGKSTLLKLLLRAYDPSAGRITVDGIDLRDYTVASLRSRIAVVPQDPFVFSGTVRENLAFGRPEASMREIVAAARTAQIDGFIDSLPQRYDTMIGERGANLSGGQRQRLAIARALLRNPDLLVFDESTSHLDTSTERALQERLHETLRGRTVLVVAHRLSTIRNADLIYVLQQGRVVEEGTHDELVERGGRYAALWNAQTGVAAA